MKDQNHRSTTLLLSLLLALLHSGFPALVGIAFSAALAQAAPFAYITNVFFDNTVSVIDTANNTVTATVAVGDFPFGVAVMPDGASVYVANQGSGTVSVIDAATNTVTATVLVQVEPFGVAATPDGASVYVANQGSDTVSVIDTATNTVTATVPVEVRPFGVAVRPDGASVYVTNEGNATVSVIDTATNIVTAIVPVGGSPLGIAVRPDGAFVYVVNSAALDETVSVIDTATNIVTAIVPVGDGPFGVAVTPDGAFAYVVNGGDSNVSVIDTTNNTVTATVPVGEGPAAFGQFIGPLPPAESVTTLCSTLGDDRPPSLLDQDIFPFTGAKDEKVTLILTSLQGLHNTGRRATLLLIDNIGKLFFARIDSSALPNTVTATLPATGRYLVTVAEHPKFLRGGAFRGNYCVTLESSMQAWRTFAPTRSVEGLLD